MLTDVINEIRPVLAELILALIGLVVAWVGARLRAKLGVDIEAIYRDSLHQALRTGVDRILDRITAASYVTDTDDRVDRVIDYVRDSVPDALKGLGPSEAQLRAMAVAKIKEAIVRATPSDPLGAALRAAGAPAVDARRNVPHVGEVR